MRVEDHRIRSLDAGEHAPPAIGEEKEAAIRRVHMEPAVLALGDGGNRVEGIHGPRVGRPGGGDNEPGPEAGRAVGPDRLGERVGPQAMAFVHRDVAKPRPPSPAIRSDFWRQ